MNQGNALSQTDRRPTASKLRIYQALLRTNLSAFTQRCFHEVAPDKAYGHNWHIDAMAHHLAEVAAGCRRRLIITLPPRSLKSHTASVAFPAWLHGRDPSKRVICASYGQTLTVDHANQYRRILKTAWYQSLFPATAIDRRKDTEEEVRLSAGGFRLTATVGGALTGRGGSIVIIDDPMKAADAMSEAARTKVNTWFDETLLSRLDDKRNDAIVLVMQRLHVDDLVGHVLERGDWTHLDLPAIAPERSMIAVGANAFHERKPGDLLHGERETQAVLDEQRIAMGTASFSAQYLQRPVPAGGNMVKLKWFSTWTSLPEKHSYSTKIVQSWDTASKASELSDYSACVTALIDRNAVYILDVFKDRLEYPQLKKKVLALKEQWNADTVLIEDKASGQNLIQDLRHDRLYTKAIEPDGDKVTRMAACTAIIETGAVHLPEAAPWMDAFKTELAAFPNTKFDDQADALSQLLNWTRNRSTYTLDNIG